MTYINRAYTASGEMVFSTHELSGRAIEAAKDAVKTNKAVIVATITQQGALVSVTRKANIGNWRTSVPVRQQADKTASKDLTIWCEGLPGRHEYRLREATQFYSLG